MCYFLPVCCVFSAVLSNSFYILVYIYLSHTCDALTYLVGGDVHVIIITICLNLIS